ncbi:glycosyltransferase [Plesiomonas sp.]|uniref:glycosyltransferase n=1 Tax=Plesiomonas sp. TaxID=2486279 RepID=UPI003F392F60
MQTAPRRITQIIQHLAPGGIETIALELHRTYQHDHQPSLISLEGNITQACENWPRVTNTIENSNSVNSLVFLDKKSGLQFGLLLKLIRLLKKSKPDVVHTHHIGPLLYGGLAARIANIKTIVHTEHDAWHLNNKKRRNLARLLLKIINPVVVADSEQVAINIRAHLPKAHPVVILNGIDTTHFIIGDRDQAREQLNLPLKEKIVGCAARLETVKGHAGLFYALKQCPELHLALAGVGSLEQQLKTLAHELNISHRVHFLGLINDMSVFYHAIDSFCLASEAEGLPLSPLEAQACGIPVVLTDVGGCRECIDPKSGQLVPLGEPASLAKALMHSVTLQAQTTSRPFVEKNASLQNMATQYLSLYQNTADDKNSQGIGA